jgi:hypothetical protein
VTIEQYGTRVTLVVSTKRGEKERIERELDKYGLVVTGRLAPEEFIDDPTEVLALRQKLELVSLELRHTQQLLGTERTMYGDHLQSLDYQVKFLTRLLDSEQYQVTKLVEAFISVSKHTTPVAKKALDRLIRMIDQGEALKDKNAALNELFIAVNEDRSIIASLEEMVLKGTVQGEAGNYLYTSLQALTAMFRK